MKAAIEGGTAKKAQPGAPAAQPGAPAPKLAPAGMSDDIVKKMFEPGSFEEVPHDGMRKTIARRLTEAKQTIPHFYLTVDCDIDALLKLREQVNASAQKDKDGKPAFKVSVNDMVIKALALALHARARRQCDVRPKIRCCITSTLTSPSPSPFPAGLSRRSFAKPTR